MRLEEEVAAATGGRGLSRSFPQHWRSSGGIFDKAISDEIGVGIAEGAAV
jgi:hypothetical protein